jgi:hypothetical protein
MRKQLVCTAEGRTVNVAWFSFQPDGSISFGLNDRTFVSPRLGAKMHLFNAYNRVRAEFIVSSNGAGLHPIVNPHFTYHPTTIKFHLTAKGDEDVFDGIADPTIILSQQPELEWIRAISKPVRDLSTGAPRPDGIKTTPWVIHSTTSDASISIAVDLVKPAPLADDRSAPLVRFVPWGGIMARVKVDVVPPAAPTLSWFHEY